MGLDEVSYGPAVGLDEVSYGPAVGLDEVWYGPAVGLDEVSYGPAVGLDEVSYGPAVGLDEVSYGPAVGLDEVSSQGSRLPRKSLGRGAQGGSQAAWEGFVCDGAECAKIAVSVIGEYAQHHKLL